MKHVNIINECEVCGNNKLESVLNLGNHALCGDLIKISSKKINIKYPINILFCQNCVTAHQKYQVNKIKLFPKSYQYRAKMTNDVLNGMLNLINFIKKNNINLKKVKVIDIGCNDGSLLNFFSKYTKYTYGVEPTDASKDISKKHKVFKCYFNKANAKKIKRKYGTFDIITFTNVFAHIEDLNQLIDSLKIISNDKTKFVIENHYLGAIIDNFQFDTFYHEHPRSYSLTSFKYIADKLDCSILNFDFPERYGGNIRVIISKNKILNYQKQKFLNVLNKEKKFFYRIKKFKSKINLWQKDLTLKLKKLNKKYGKIRAKAFPGRAAIPIEMLKKSEKYISMVYEKDNSLKIGYYVPGTRIKIVKDSELNVDNKAPIINLAWHINSEIKKYLKDIGVKSKIFPIIKK